MTIRPEQESLAQRILAGLSATPKTLPSAYLYDDEGSRLFRAIMTLPEYYLTRAESRILEQQGTRLAKRCAELLGKTRIEVVELGAGDGTKLATLCTSLLDAKLEPVLHPLDISSAALDELSTRLRATHPTIPVFPRCGDYFEVWPELPADAAQLVLFLGSNLGNLRHDQAVDLFRQIKRNMGPRGLLLVGIDLQKHPRTIRRAYDDSSDVTARFNLNLLTRMNRELGFDFDLGGFSHYAAYDPASGSAKSFLVSEREQTVHSRAFDATFWFARGEAIQTEQSQKYTPAMLEDYARQSGLVVHDWFRNEDEAAAYVIAALGERHPAG
jgi:L-histidine Nalpha-methyltransferase